MTSPILIIGLIATVVLEAVVIAVVCIERKIYKESSDMWMAQFEIMLEAYVSATYDVDERKEPSDARL